MSYLLSVAGLLLILIGLRDVFHQLVHPGGKGGVSWWVMRGCWWCFRAIARWRPSMLVLAGPFAFVCIMISWALLLITGWGLVYWAHLPEGFTLSPGMDPHENSGFLDAIYLSSVSLSTLGFGDITPKLTWLRLLAPVQALVGFVLLSAGITWLLSVYPSLSKARALAHSVALLPVSNTGQLAVNSLNAAFLAELFLSLAEKLNSLQSEWSQFPIAYFFYTQVPKHALPVALPRLLNLADQGCKGSAPEEVRFAALYLRRSIDDFADHLASTFLNIPGRPTETVLAFYQCDHQH